MVVMVCFIRPHPALLLPAPPLPFQLSNTNVTVCMAIDQSRCIRRQYRWDAAVQGGSDGAKVGSRAAGEVSE